MGLTYTGIDGLPIASLNEVLTLGDSVDRLEYRVLTDNDKCEALSDDGMGITWAIPSSDLDSSTLVDGADSSGGTVVIGGILADASAVGNGEDITVTVIVSRRGGFWQSG